MLGLRLELLALLLDVPEDRQGEGKAPVRHGMEDTPEDVHVLVLLQGCGLPPRLWDAVRWSGEATCSKRIVGLKKDQLASRTARFPTALSQPRPPECFECLMDVMP